MNKFVLYTYPLLIISTLTLLWQFVPTHPTVKAVKPLTHVIVTPTPLPFRHLSDLVSNYISLSFGKQASQAAQIAAEHNSDCNYGKGTTHVGLFAIDINDPRAKGKNLNDCLDNIDVAKAIYQSEGLAPWGK